MQPVRQTHRNLAINYCSLLSTQRPLDTVAELVGFPPVAGDRASYPDCRLGVRGGGAVISRAQPVYLQLRKNPHRAEGAKRRAIGCATL